LSGKGQKFTPPLRIQPRVEYSIEFPHILAFLSLFLAVFAPTVSLADVAATTYVDAAVAPLNNKTDKKIPAAPGNIATLDASGNLSDGGIMVTDLTTDAELTTALSQKVSTTGAESISGVKTFSDIPLIPTASLPTAP
jgi:hypothetical protein